MKFYTYILQCSDNSYYVGHTNNLEARLHEHNSGLGAKYTRHRLPVKMLYSEPYATRTEAAARETQLKKWSKSKKAALIEGNVAELHQLAKRHSD